MTFKFGQKVQIVPNKVVAGSIGEFYDSEHAEFYVVEKIPFSNKYRVLANLQEFGVNFILAVQFQEDELQEAK